MSFFQYLVLTINVAALAVVTVAVAVTLRRGDRAMRRSHVLLDKRLALLDAQQQVHRELLGQLLLARPLLNLDEERRRRLVAGAAARREVPRA